ncbi:MAG: type IV pilus twitching motility protein PilT [Myxococcales bacterium]
MAKLDALLRKAVEIGASDVHLTVDLPPVLRRFGQLKRAGGNALGAPQIEGLLLELLDPEQRERLRAHNELDFAYEIPSEARFRCNAFRHRKGIDVCFRVVMASLPGFEKLGIPDVLKEVCENHQGLILVTGPAGSGKSTTLAALVDLINGRRALHVLTIEDPIEYVHPLKKGAVNQRQLGRHTRSYANALRAALREDPDVIMVGELRDIETISLAVSAAETGHLVVGSLNTGSAHKTLNRIIDAYPASQQNQIRAMVGESLKAVFSQKLLPRADGNGVVLAYELLLGSLQLAAMIRDGKTFQIPNLMQTGKSRGMRLLDESLQELLQKGLITGETAYRAASNQAAFAKFAPAGEAAAAPAASAPAGTPAQAPGAARPAAPGRPVIPPRSR